jgi:hypothetical protein
MIMMVSPPAKREVRLATDPIMTSTSPDNRTCTAIELAVMLITSPSMRFFFNSPRSSTTQIGVWAGLEPDQAILKRS